MSRKICVATGTRAEYGILYWILKQLQESPQIELQLVVTGMHLSEEYGNTFRLIEQDGFCISEKVKMPLSNNTSRGVTESVGHGLIGFAEAFERLQPDLLLLVGDRFEALAAAQAALFRGLPIAHIHGGETSAGAIDESIRHAITKMASLHFVSAAEHGLRVCQLGENPDAIFDVGAPGLDHIVKLNLLSKKDLETDLKISLNAPIFLITFHPETAGNTNVVEQTNELLKALDEFPEATKIFTRPNADADSRLINELITQYCEKNNSYVFTSLGQRRYLSLLKWADVVVGNSSSGLIEAPAVQTPTVNIGDRQLGRLQGETVINCKCISLEIGYSIKKSLDPKWRLILEKSRSPYGDGHSSYRICKILIESPLEGLTKKRFFDVR